MRPLALLVIVAAFPAAARADANVDDPWFARDKAYHFSVCSLLGAGGYGLSALVLERPYQRALTGAGVSVAVGALKEGVDALGYGDPSPRDFAWDVLGAGVGVGLAYAIDALWPAASQERAWVRREGAAFRF
jgi:putative lipoprotein